MALPPSVPGYHASSIAGTCCDAHVMLSGRPLSNTKHDWLAGCHRSLEKLLLPSRKRKCGTGSALAAHILRLS